MDLQGLGFKQLQVYLSWENKHTHNHSLQEIEASKSSAPMQRGGPSWTDHEIHLSTPERLSPDNVMPRETQQPATRTSMVRPHVAQAECPVLASQRPGSSNAGW
ncbi:unnamed protein product [Clonostachys byssicola]|uniref:Uncharacterized protein n=1 Tax=Clonostachys byssicola TaxID=160290 RepID=A0A9N9U7D9_9HYPO|nr:unnamed protein product [Clonostachys byssicola]